MDSLKTILNISRYIWVNPSNEGEKLRRSFLALAWQLYKRLIRIPLVLRLDNGLDYIAYPWAGNATGAIYTRIYEPEYVIFLRKHNSSRNSILIDVGAHTGLFALLLADQVESGYCFEPAIDNFHILQKNLAINLLHMTALPIAVSSSPGRLVFTRTGSYSGTNHLGGAYSEDENSVSEEVDVTTIDLECIASSLPIGILKIDTEGHELEVLRGAQELIARSPEGLALVENSGFEKIEEFFKLLGWKTFAINKQGEILTSTSAKKLAYNLLACGPNHPLVKKIDEAKQNGDNKISS